MSLQLLQDPKNLLPWIINPARNPSWKKPPADLPQPFDIYNYTDQEADNTITGIMPNWQSTPCKVVVRLCCLFFCLEADLIAKEDK